MTAAERDADWWNCAEFTTMVSKLGKVVSPVALEYMRSAYRATETGWKGVRDALMSDPEWREEIFLYRLGRGR